MITMTIIIIRMTKDNNDYHHHHHHHHPHLHHHSHHLRVDFEREIEWLRAKRDEVWQRVALLERVAGEGHYHDCDHYCHDGDDDD